MGRGFDRFDAIRVLHAIDAALSSPGGAMVGALAAQLECDPSTVRRYLQAMAELGAPLVGTAGGPFRYGRPFKLFTDEAGDVLGI